ncbi:hypothetical protein ACOSP7_010123 [Xanthoceras sorbifolium]
MGDVRSAGGGLPLHCGLEEVDPGPVGAGNNNHVVGLDPGLAKAPLVATEITGFGAGLLASAIKYVEGAVSSKRDVFYFNSGERKRRRWKARARSSNMVIVPACSISSANKRKLVGDALRVDQKKLKLSPSSTPQAPSDCDFDLASSTHGACPI